MEQRSAWVSNVWGTGNEAAQEKRALKQGEEACPICLTDPVEVKFKPCGHDICLECCNRMRAANVFKADAGIKCGMCRQYIEMYTDLNGNPSSVPSLRAANQAAAKSKAGRQAGQDAAVSTSVPNPARLVPPVSSSPEPTWYCDKCRHLNTGNKAECSRCRCANPSHVKPNTSKDPLNCPAEEIVKSAKEKNHPNLNKALLDAGTPWAQGKVGGTVESIKKALRSKGHERLMRVVKVLSEGSNMESVALDILGNYTVQNLLEATHRLRGVAHQMAQQGHPPSEVFNAVNGVTAATAFGLLLRALLPLTPHLGPDSHGVYVMVKLTNLAAPPEVILLGQTTVPQFLDYLQHKEMHGMLFVTTLVERLKQLRAEGGTHTHAAATLLANMCNLYCSNQKSLMWAARNQFGGPMVINIIQGALPAADAFKVGWSVATSAGGLVHHRNGVRTLELLCTLRAMDGRCAEMIRDLACYLAKALQGDLAGVAAKKEDGGDKLIKALLTQLQVHREDAWVEWVVSELVMAGGQLAQDKSGRELLQFALSMPTLPNDVLSQHMRRLEDSLDSHFRPLQQQVQSNRASPDKLPRQIHSAPSEVSPFAPPDAIRKFPVYLRDAHAHHPQHSMLKRHTSAPGGNAVPPPPPPPPQPPKQQDHPGSPDKGRQPPPGFGGGVTAAAAANGGLVKYAISQPSFPPRPAVPQPTSMPAAAPQPIHQQQQQAAARGPSPSGHPAPAAAPAAAGQHAYMPPPGFSGPTAQQQQQQQQQQQPVHQPPLSPPQPQQQPAQQPLSPPQPQRQQPPPQMPQVPPALQQAPPPLAHPSSAFTSMQHQQQQQHQQQVPPAMGYPASSAYAPAQQAQQQEAAPTPPTPSLHAAAMPAAQAPSPMSDPSSFFPRPGPHSSAAPPKAAAPAAAAYLPPPPPLARPHQPAAPAPAAPPAPPAAPAAAAPAAAVTPSPAYEGFTSLPELLAQLTMMGGPPPAQPPLAPAPAVPAVPAAASAAPPPALAVPGQQRPPGRPGGSYRPVQLQAPAGGVQAGYGYATPAAAAPQRQQPAAPPGLSAAPSFTYMQQQAALPQTPVALFHPTASAQPQLPQPARQAPPAPAPMPRPQPPSPAPAQAQQPSWNAAVAAAAPVAASSGSPDWACEVCTYVHTGKEANFLACALCGAPQTGL